MISVVIPIFSRACNLLPVPDSFYRQKFVLREILADNGIVDDDIVARNDTDVCPEKLKYRQAGIHWSCARRHIHPAAALRGRSHVRFCTYFFRQYFNAVMARQGQKKRFPGGMISDGVYHSIAHDPVRDWLNLKMKEVWK